MSNPNTYAPRAESQPMMIPLMMGRPLPDPPPVSVLTAMEFISRCNDQMGLQVVQFRAYDGDSEFEVVDHELHPTQEGAFRNALQLLNVYFNSETQRMAPEPQEEPAVEPQRKTDSLSVSQYVMSGEGI